MKTKLTFLIACLLTAFMFKANGTVRHYCPPENLAVSNGEAPGSMLLHWTHPTDAECSLIDGFEVMVRTCINNDHTTTVYYVNDIYMPLEVPPGATCSWKVRSISHVDLVTERHSIWARGPDIGAEAGRLDPWDEEEVFNEAMVYPNPVYDNNMVVHVNSLNKTDLHLEIISLTGQTVYDQTFRLEKGSNYGDIDLAQLRAGVYFVRVSNGYKTRTEKIIKL